MTLDEIKMALPVTTTAYDDEITRLWTAALRDLGIAGVDVTAPADEIVDTAVVTYIKLHFNKLSDTEYRNMKASYDEQKAQLTMATGYTDWSE